MSRETDSPSPGPGPQGRGGAAYPSGTPPYGTRPFPSLHPQERPRDPQPTADDAPAADEPKTETTLTTRVRINIPGSRPIPPVVVRTPVDEAAPEPTELPAGWTVGGDASPAAGGAPAPQAPPRAAAAPPAPAPKAPAAEPERPAPSDWFAPRKAGGPAGPAAPAPQTPPPPPAAAQPPAGLAGPAGRPVGPDATQPLSLGDIAAAGPAPQQPQGPRPNIPYLNEGPAAPGPRTQRAGAPGGPGPHPFPGAPGAPGGTGTGAPGPFPGAPGSPGGTGAGAPGGTPFTGFRPPAGPTSGPVTGEMRVPPAVPGRPAFPGAPGAPGAPAAPRMPGAPGAPADRISGDTMVNGIPAVPPAGPPVTRPVQPGSDSYRFQADQDEPEPKGRSKVILVGVALLVAAGLAYGAGLAMDHAEVPAGTTILGIDIGGKSTDEAAAALDAALGDRETAALTVTIGDQEKKLKPSSAGLGIDIDATVSSVAHRDYNPVTVIGSLFGGTRVAEPTMVTDEEKLRAQLTTLSDQLSGGDTGSEGMVKFVKGKAVAVPGEVHQAINVPGSVDKVAAAYRTRLETGAGSPVALSVTTEQPKVTQAKLDAAVNGFGKTAMSGTVTVNGIPFSPEKSLSQILTMVPDDAGNLTPFIDTEVLAQLYGSAYDGVLVERGDGTTSAVKPTDVASAMLPALQTTDPAKKTVTIDGTS